MVSVNEEEGAGLSLTYTLLLFLGKSAKAEETLEKAEETLSSFLDTERPGTEAWNTKYIGLYEEQRASSKKNEEAQTEVYHTMTTMGIPFTGPGLESLLKLANDPDQATVNQRIENSGLLELDTLVHFWNVSGVDHGHIII